MLKILDRPIENHLINIDDTEDSMLERDFLPEILSKPDAFTVYPADMLPIDSTIAHGIIYSVVKLDRLSIGKRLDDDIINIFLKYIVIPNATVEGVQCVSTFFFHKLYFGNESSDVDTIVHYYNYNSAEPYWDCAAKANIILIPIIHSNHWTLMVLNQNENQIHYHDSLGLDQGRDGLQYMEVLKRFVISYNEKHSRDSNSKKEWVMFGCKHHHKYMTKQNKFKPPFPQRNDYDCGVFLIRYAMCYSNDLPIRKITEDCAPMRAQIKKNLLGLYVHYRKSFPDDSVTLGLINDAHEEAMKDLNPDGELILNVDMMPSLDELREANNRRAEVSLELVKIVEAVEKHEGVAVPLKSTPSKKRRLGDYELPSYASPSKYSRANREYTRVLRNRLIETEDLDDAIPDMSNMEPANQNLTSTEPSVCIAKSTEEKPSIDCIDDDTLDKMTVAEIQSGL